MKKARKMVASLLAAAISLAGIGGTALAEAPPFPAGDELSIPSESDESISSFQWALVEARELLQRYAGQNHSTIDSASGPINRVRSGRKYPAVLSDIIMYYDRQRLVISLTDASASTVGDRAFLSELDALVAAYPQHIQKGSGEVSLNRRNEWLDIIYAVSDNDKYRISTAFWSEEDQRLHIVMPGASEDCERLFREEVLDHSLLVFDREALSPQQMLGIPDGISWFEQRLDEPVLEEAFPDDVIPPDETSSGATEKVQVRAYVIRIPIFEKKKNISFGWKNMKNASQYQYQITDLNSGKKVQSHTVEQRKALYKASRSKNETTYRVDVSGYNNKNEKVETYTAFFHVGSKKKACTQKPYAPNVSKAKMVQFSKENCTGEMRYRVVGASR